MCAVGGENGHTGGMLYLVGSLRYVQFVNPARHEVVTERLRAGMALNPSFRADNTFPSAR